MKKIKIRLLCCFFSGCSFIFSQTKFDSLPSSCGLAEFLVSGPFNCPDPKQKIKFPKQFYKESKQEVILSIADGKIEKGISCISEKKDFSYYDEAKHFCEWWFPLQYIPAQCDKWKRAGAGGASPYFKKEFYRKLASLNLPHELYIPDLSFHYFYFDADTIPDLAAYDCTDGNGPCSEFIVPADSIRIIPNLYGYAYDVRKKRNELLILTNWGPYQEGFSCHSNYKFIFKDKLFLRTDSFIIASIKGLKLPSYTLDKKFRLKMKGKLGNRSEESNEHDEYFPAGSVGYVLGEEGDQYFVAMTNNLETEKKIFQNYIEKRLRQKFWKFYILGWVKKDVISFE